MTNQSYSQAAKAINAKAQRLGSSAATAKRNGDEKLRQADALQAIADAVAKGQPSLQQWINKVLSSNEVTAEDFKLAATEVYSLATRKESKSSVSETDLSSIGEWERSNDDVNSYVHKDTLQQAIYLYELATTLHNEEYWTYLKGLLLSRIENYSAAIQAFESLQGIYAQYGKEQADQCRKRMSGTYDAAAEMEAQFSNLLSKMKTPPNLLDGLGADPLSALKDMLSQFSANAESIEQMTKQFDDEEDDADQTSHQAVEKDDAKLDQAALTAQMFAEHLANADYAAAHNLLSQSLRKQMSVKAVEQQYRQMVEIEGNVDPEVEICVMSSEGDMPQMTTEDLGWVYVAITGDGFSEAITVIVTQENGDAKIRDLEWGRP